VTSFGLPGFTTVSVLVSLYCRSKHVSFEFHNECVVNVINNPRTFTFDDCLFPRYMIRTELNKLSGQSFDDNYNLTTEM